MAFPNEIAAYAHVKELGAGGGGVVHSCVANHDGQSYAIKIVPLCNLCEKHIFPETRSLFQDHPNILRCYKAWVECFAPDFACTTKLAQIHADYGFECGNPTHYLYLLMEECEGNLSTLRSLKTLDVETVFVDCLKGLEYIHSKGLIHGDISFNNIFLDLSGTAKLGDFGCVSDEGIPRPLGGVPLYHAPELKEKAAEWDYEDTPIDEQLCLMTKASDIYALALVVTELVYPPMATLIEKELFLTDIKASRVFPTQGTVSTACIAQLVEMLNKDPKCRPDAKSIRMEIGQSG
ncbi:serine/threonine-protein kinase mos-like isoform X1 [Salvia hispanica]|uniref:serine/threonine-protein kinase mos-like isoform X1 n=1 Tax=Salvia hispanica TaxID=49212 RepID=UPI002009858B|nr:serine/threonine-protein kinase mos-like isoform X1 [Salvia hispanica]